jgi:hypothetical protein
LPDNNKNEKLTLADIILRGSIIAVIVAVPSIASFLIAWLVLDDLVIAIIIGAVVHFIAIGFSLKISKKLLVKRKP